MHWLQEVYSKLEEPDGLGGLLQLRQGGPCLQDQILAAEKSGNWPEALTLYEQACPKQKPALKLQATQIVKVVTEVSGWIGPLMHSGAATGRSKQCSIQACRTRVSSLLSRRPYIAAKHGREAEHGQLRPSVQLQTLTHPSARLWVGSA